MTDDRMSGMAGDQDYVSQLMAEIREKDDEIERLNGLVGYQEGLHEKLERDYVKAIKERRAAEAEIERLRKENASMRSGSRQWQRNYAPDTLLDPMGHPEGGRNE